MIVKIFSFLLFATIQNSIIPKIDQVEDLNQLPREKFAEKQFEEISKALLHKEKFLRVMTYNMLFDLYDNEMEPLYRWPARLPRIVEVVEESKADVIGLQELQEHQVVDLMNKIGKTYELYQRSHPIGETNGILFNKNRFTFIEGRFWNMLEGSHFKKPNYLTMVLLQDKKTKETISVFNVHLSYRDIQARDKEVMSIKNHIQSFAAEHPIILMGDLNTFPAWVDDTSIPFWDGDYIVKNIEEIPLQDSLTASIIGHVGPNGTFTNNPSSEKPKPFSGTGNPGIYLDHIFVSNEIGVLLHAVNPAKVDNAFPSDHMPVIIDCFIPK